ncbi:MAG: helix-turn-helix transcriptional regulator [Ferruginibacter sp.]
MLQICENIKQARISSDKTQDEMAALLKVSRSTYQNWERETEPAVATLREIAQILNIPLGKLLNEDLNHGSSLEKPCSSVTLLEIIANMAKSELILSERIKSLALQVEFSSNEPKQNGQESAFLPKQIFEKMAVAGVPTLWKSKDQGLIILGKLLAGDFRKKDE